MGHVGCNRAARGESLAAFLQKRQREMNANESASDEIRASFANALNRHGYGFQYAVLKKCRDVAVDLEKNWSPSTWQALVSEFPVEVQSAGTKIDFILRRITRLSAPGLPVYLLAECKRANPALSNWCFARAPYVHHAWPLNYEPLIVERFNASGTDSFAVEVYHSVPSGYQLGLEVRHASKGDNRGESGEAIEKAASQVLRGLNGFVEMLNRNTQLLDEHPHAYLVPVIFTTANLFGSDVDLSDADLETGISDVKKESLKPLGWLCYQYHTSPGIKHSRSLLKKPSVLGNLMQTEYIRTVPIVTPGGIEPFFAWLSGLRFE
jgi:hypothetical protein